MMIVIVLNEICISMLLGMLEHQKAIKSFGILRWVDESLTRIHDETRLKSAISLKFCLTSKLKILVIVKKRQGLSSGEYLWYDAVGCYTEFLFSHTVDGMLWIGG